MRICCLGSGSAGNCFALWSGDEGILVDVGLSCRQTVQRMRKRDIDPRIFKACLITHSHGDHIAGLARWVEQYDTPVFATQGTADTVEFLVRHPGIMQPIGVRERFKVGPFEVKAVPTVHFPAIEPVTFTISNGNGARFSMLYETGRITAEMMKDAEGATGLLLESNHDRQMLAGNEERPLFILQRTAAGHLANESSPDDPMGGAADVLRKLHPATKVVILCHLSTSNNRPELARRVAQEALDAAGLHVRLLVASQDEPTEIIELQ